MKKLLAASFVVLFLAALLPKPASAEVTFGFGLKGGVSMAKLNEVYFGESYPSTSMTKPLFGGFLAINLNEMFTFQPEIYYLTKGGVWDEDFDGDNFLYEDTLNYVHVPLLAKVHLIKEGKANPILFAGPAVNILVSSNKKLTINGVIDEDRSFDEIKSTAFSLVFGGGIEIMLNKIKLILDVRYDLGLDNLIKPEFAEDWSYKSKTLMFVAGVGF
jgi:hypothetical protein